MTKLTNLSHAISKLKKHPELIVDNISIIINIAKLECQLDMCAGYARKFKKGLTMLDMLTGDWAPSEFSDRHLRTRKQLVREYKGCLKTLLMELKEVENARDVARTEIIIKK